MAEFFTSLFQSIFTPGPTPSLVLATNISFAALQTLLLILSIATYNIHFIVLSGLSAGLWWSVNWFVRELQAAKAEGKKKDDSSGAAGNWAGDKIARDARAESEDTETEDVTGIDTDRDGVRLRVPPTQQGRAPSRASTAASASGTDSEWDQVEADEI